MKRKFKPKFDEFGGYVILSAVGGMFMLALFGFPLSDYMANINASKKLAHCDLQDAVTASQVHDVLSACPIKLQPDALKALNHYEENAIVQDRTIQSISEGIENQVSRDIRPYWMYVLIATLPAFIFLCLSISDGMVRLFEDDRESLERVFAQDMSEK